MEIRNDDGDRAILPAQGDCARRTMGLSARELEVMECLVRGCANKEIAAALDVSPSTVDTHLRRLFAKLGVHSRTSAVVTYLNAQRQ